MTPGQMNRPGFLVYGLLFLELAVYFLRSITDCGFQIGLVSLAVQLGNRRICFQQCVVVGRELRG